MKIRYFAFTCFAVAALVLPITVVASSSFADEGPHYCESGDPGGLGPSADIERTGTDFKITVNYNRRNLDSSSRSAVYNFSGAPNAVVEVKEQGADCVRSTFKTPRSKKVVDFIWCEADSFGILKLTNFTPLNPDYEIGCD